MNLDDLVNSIPESEAELRVALKHWVDAWKNGTESVDALEYYIGKLHGNVWFKDPENSNRFYRDFTAFRKEAIERIGGMTMNERLYAFGLFERWDESDESARLSMRQKLKANA